MIVVFHNRPDRKLWKKYHKEKHKKNCRQTNDNADKHKRIKGSQSKNIEETFKYYKIEKEKDIKRLADNEVKTLYFRDTNLMKLEENEYIKEVNNWGEIYRHIKEISKTCRRDK